MWLQHIQYIQGGEINDIMDSFIEELLQTFMKLMLEFSQVLCDFIPLVDEVIYPPGRLEMISREVGLLPAVVTHIFS